MTKTFCDICGKEITDTFREFKIKKRVHSFHESWWEKMDVHTSCWANLCDILKDLKSQEERKDLTDVKESMLRY